MSSRPAASLTKLEGEVMRAVWELPGPVRVRDVVDAVNARRDPALAYTTVQTMLNILTEKGVLGQIRGAGRAYLYEPRVSRDQASGSMLRDLADRMFGGRIEPLLMQLMDQSKLGPSELRQLRDWAETQLRDHPEDRS